MYSFLLFFPQINNERTHAKNLVEMFQVNHTKRMDEIL
jgi:hypothetical protein